MDRENRIHRGSCYVIIKEAIVSTQNSFYFLNIFILKLHNLNGQVKVSLGETSFMFYVLVHCTLLKAQLHGKQALKSKQTLKENKSVL